MTRVLKGLGLALLICALAPAAALANDYYVSQSGTGAACTNPSTPCDLATALSQANAASGSNTVHITGPLTLSGLASTLYVGSLSPGQSVSLVGSGSGSGGTSLSSTGVPVLYIYGGSSVSHLAAQSGTTPITTYLGGSVDDVVATTTGTMSPALSVASTPATGDTTIAHAVLNAPSNSTFATLVTAGDALHHTTVSDSKISGGMGLADASVPLPGVTGGVHVVRSLIDVTGNAVSIGTSSASISDSVIRVSSAAAQAVTMGMGFVGVSPHVDLLQDTIIGPGTGTAVSIPPALIPFLPGSATITGSIIRGFGTDLDVQQPPPGTFTGGSATATYSDFDEPTSGTGNLATDPKFANAAAADYTILPGSPLIDAAGTAAANGETDRAGNPRVVDGNGDGAAARDMGAYEYQPPPAPPAPPAAPAAPAAPAKPRAATLKLTLPHGTLTLGAGRVVLFNLGCPAGQGSSCSVTVTLRGVARSARSKTVKLGTGHAVIAPGRRAKVKIRLTRKAVALIKAGKLRRVVALVTGRDAAGGSARPKHTYRIRYKAPRHHYAAERLAPLRTALPPSSR